MSKKLATREKRAQLRDTLWPGIARSIYPQPGEQGWCRLPRAMPLILQLLSDKRLSLGMDLSRTYLGLWADNFGDGLVEVDDEERYAAVAGFKGSRGLRSWRDRVKRLAALGFLETVTGSTSRIGFVAIISPANAIAGLPDRGFTIPEGWLAAYTERMVRSRAGERSSVYGDGSQTFDTQMETLHHRLADLRNRIVHGMPLVVAGTRAYSSPGPGPKLMHATIDPNAEDETVTEHSQRPQDAVPGPEDEEIPY